MVDAFLSLAANPILPLVVGFLAVTLWRLGKSIPSLILLGAFLPGTHALLLMPYFLFLSLREGGLIRLGFALAAGVPFVRWLSSGHLVPSSEALNLFLCLGLGTRPLALRGLDRAFLGALFLAAATGLALLYRRGMASLERSPERPERLAALGLGAGLLLASCVPGLPADASLILVALAPVLSPGESRPLRQAWFFTTLVFLFERILFEGGALQAAPGWIPFRPSVAFGLAAKLGLSALWLSLFFRAEPLRDGARLPTRQNARSLWEKWWRSPARLPQRFSLSWKDALWLTAVTSLALFLTLEGLGSRRFPSTWTRSETQWRIQPEATIEGLWVVTGNDWVKLEIRCGSESPKQRLTIPRAHGYEWRFARLDRGCPSELELSLHSKGPDAVLEILLADVNGRPLRTGKVCGPTGCQALSAHPLFDESAHLDAPPGRKDGVVFDESFNVDAGLKRRTGDYHLATVHPLMGRALVALSMELFGVNPWAWRLPGALAGALLPLLLFFLCRELFPARSAAWLAAVLSLGDTFRLGLSRLATVDAQLTALVVCMHLFALRYYRKRTEPSPGTVKSFDWRDVRDLTLLGIWVGMAAATKWIGLFSLPLVLVVVVAAMSFGPRKLSWKIPSLSLVLLLLVAASLYLSSFFPFLAPGSRLSEAAAHQFKMLKTHLNSSPHHPFASKFWSWPFVDKPFPIFLPDLKTQPLSEFVYLIPNPVIWWALIPCLFGLLFSKRIGKGTAARYLVAAFALQYLAWALVPRSTFLYHFSTATPFGIVAIAIVLSAPTGGLGKKLRLGYLGAMTLVALWLYPVTVGKPMSWDTFKRYRLFAGWFQEDAHPVRFRVETPARNWAKGSASKASSEGT